VIHEERHTIAFKQDIEQVARVKNPLDAANASGGQPMHALRGADVIADLKAGSCFHCSCFSVPQMPDGLGQLPALVRGVHTPARGQRSGHMECSHCGPVCLSVDLRNSGQTTCENARLDCSRGVGARGVGRLCPVSSSLLSGWLQRSRHIVHLAARRSSVASSAPRK
jgi:hypothetical protein